MSGQNDAAQPDKERDLHGAALSLIDTTPEQFRRMGLQHHRLVRHLHPTIPRARGQEACQDARPDEAGQEGAMTPPL
jgi:hypothetical protein